MSCGRPPASSTARHGSVSSICSTPSLATRKAIVLPRRGLFVCAMVRFSISVVGFFFLSLSWRVPGPDGETNERGRWRAPPGDGYDVGMQPRDVVTTVLVTVVWGLGFVGNKGVLAHSPSRTTR